jgi:hypothetical protein
MAINWNQAEYVSPKLQITPDQLPLEAGIKVGDILQGRYDKAIETDTKIGALTKKLMGSVDPSDQALAKEITATYGERLKERAGKGDYQNMQWQTMADADDFANIYTGLTSRAKSLAEGRKQIAESKDYFLAGSREAALERYNNSVGSAAFDKENRFVSNLTVNPFKEAADQDVLNEFLKVAPHIRTNTSKGKDAYIGYIDETGKPTNSPVPGKSFMAKITQTGDYERLTSTDIHNEMIKFGKAHSGIDAMLERDLDRANIQNPEERLLAKEQLYKRHLEDAANSVSTMFDYAKDSRKTDFQVLGATTASNAGGYLPIDADLKNMIPSQGEVVINDSYTKAKNQLDKLQFTDNGDLDVSTVTTAEQNSRELFGDVKEFMNLISPKSKEEVMRSMVPPKFYDNLKAKGLTDKHIASAYASHMDKQRKTVNTGYSLVFGEDQKQAINAVSAAIADNQFTSSSGDAVKGSDIKGGDIKFYPGLGTYKIIKDGETYTPTTKIPFVEKQMAFSKELIDDFTDIGSMTNIVTHPHLPYTISIVKDEIRPDGTYTGKVGVAVKNADGTYSQSANPVSFDTKKEGLTPDVINKKVHGAIKLATQSLGVQ